MTSRYDDFQTTPHAVYAIIESGCIVYVGCSLHPWRRFSQHKSKGKCAEDAKLRIIRWYDNPQKAYHYEKFYIQKHLPRYNIRNMPTWVKSWVGRAAGFKRTWSKDALYREFGRRGVPAGPKMKQN